MSILQLYMINVAILDEQLLFAEGIAQLLKTYISGATVRVFQQFDMLLDELQDGYKPEVLLYGIPQSMESGLEILPVLKPYMQLGMRIIIASTHGSVSMIKKALSEGVMGFLNKAGSSSRLLEAISCVKDESIYIDKAWQMGLYKSIADGEQKLPVLTEKEAEVLSLLCKGSTVKHISSTMNISISTVQFYIKNLFRKFNLNRTLDLVIFALNNGLHISQKVNMPY